MISKPKSGLVINMQAHRPQSTLTGMIGGGVQSWGGGDGGMPPDIPERVAALERRADKADEKLVAILEQLANITSKLDYLASGQDVAIIKTRLDSMPERKEFGSLAETVSGIKSKVDNLPTWMNILLIVSTSVGLVAGFANLDRIIRAVREPVNVSGPLQLPISFHAGSMP